MESYAAGETTPALIDQTIADRPGVPAATIANLLALDIR